MSAKAKGNPFAFATSALGQKTSKKRQASTPKKAPTKRAKKVTPPKLLPVINLDPEVAQKGDDERRTGGGLRAAPPRNFHDFKANVDPSYPTNQVPTNDPVTSSTEHPAASAIAEDGGLAVAGQRATLGDQVSAATDATKRMGATLPSGHNANAANIQLQAQLATLQNNTRAEGKDVADTTVPGASPPYSADIINSNSTDPLTSEQAQRASQGDTLRPLYGIANPLSVIPSTRDQIKSGILFSDFSIVAPGFGLGVNNKMFVMEEMRQEKIQYREPLAFPRTDAGPTNTVLPPPLEWQNSIAKTDFNRIRRQKKDSLARKMFISQLVGTGSTNILGDDYGLLRDTSAKGLPRPKDEVLEPVIFKPTPMERIRPLCGSQLEGKQLRRLFDAERYPEHFTVNMGQDGGSVFGRRSALKQLPFVVGMA